MFINSENSTLLINSCFTQRILMFLQLFSFYLELEVGTKKDRAERHDFTIIIPIILQQAS